MELWKDCAEETIQKINQRAQIKKVRKGATLYEQKAWCTSLDFVMEGTLQAYHLHENGQIMQLFQFKKNQSIGANLLFGTQHQYPLTIYCDEDATILSLPKDVVYECLQDFTFSMHFIELLSMNSQGMNHKLSMFTQKTLRENILDYLHLCAVKQNSKQIQLEVTKKELADLLGVQRYSLFRELKKLKEEQCIEINNRTITLL